MALPAWSEVRESLTAAIRDALPLQIARGVMTKRRNPFGADPRVA